MLRPSSSRNATATRDGVRTKSRLQRPDKASGLVSNRARLALGGGVGLSGSGTSIACFQAVVAHYDELWPRVDAKSALKIPLPDRRLRLPLHHHLTHPRSAAPPSLLCPAGVGAFLPPGHVRASCLSAFAGESRHLSFSYCCCCCPVGLSRNPAVRRGSAHRPPSQARPPQHARRMRIVGAPAIFT